MTNVAIIYYSSTGRTHQVAQAVEAGARAAGATTRLRRVPELAPEAAIASNPAWKAHQEATQDVPVASLDDLDWADGYVLGTPTRFGNVSAQLKQFIDTAGGLWYQGKLADKAAAAFTGAATLHGGQEATLLALATTFHHWGAILVPPGYTDASIYAAGGNPYGVSFQDTRDENPVPEEVLAAARHMGGRLTRVAAAVKNLRIQPAAEAAGG
jgi:NAD(P)H dehydrogenase (quinone)